jgi:hypothetical protein
MKTWLWLKTVYLHAKGKVTTWVALGIAGLSQLADHAEELITQAPGLRPFLPAGTTVEHLLHGVLSGLGILVVWTRIRRLLTPAR